jgi:hypothetical protein
MRRIALSLAFLGLGTVLLFGCSSTRVRKDPGPLDHGIRYWRPKPYLVIQPGDTADTVKLSVDYLPDWNEEYSIHIRAGIGTNATKVTLEHGWNLTAIDVDVDSKVPEFLNSLANLIPAVGKTFGDQKGGGGPGVTPPKEFVLPAHNVPLGYYEAVVLCGPDGTKRLCGWRYVGFAPFGGCQTDLSCQALGGTSDLYGLVLLNGTYCFARLPDIATYPAVPSAGKGTGAGTQGGPGK